MNLVAAKNWHFTFLAEHMRLDEQRHVLALSGADTFDPEVAAAAAIATPGIRFTVMGPHGMPVVAGGFVPLRGQCWEGWMMGTLESWQSHYRHISRAVRWAIAQLFEQGATRLQVTTLADRDSALDWYERALGMHCDGTLRAAGAHGEDLVIYSRLAGGTP